MKKKELERYIERSKKILEDSPQMDEANTKKKIIEPLIELLGWDLYSSEVKLEYQVQSGSTSKNVDYALLLNDSPVVFLETKGSGRKIRDKDVKQLESYMKLDDVGFGLISNGDSFRVLRTEWRKRETEVSELGAFSLDEISDELNFIKLLSRKSIESGKSETIAKNIEKSRKAVEKLRENKSKIVEEVAGIIGKEIGEFNPDKIESQSAKFLEELISTLREPVREQIETEEKKVPEISRGELKKYESGEVIVCPSNPDGVNFLLQYHAWGFIRIGREPKYLLIYLTKPESEVKYFGKIDEIVPPESEKSPVSDYEEYEHYEPGKKILVLEEGSLKKLENPIPLGDKVPYSQRYSKLEKLISAETTDDIL